MFPLGLPDSPQYSALNYRAVHHKVLTKARVPLFMLIVLIQ